MYRLPACLLVLFVVTASCTTDYQLGKEDPNFGLPNALAGQKQPGPSSAADDKSGTTGQPECVKAGGTLVNNANCAVSFKTDVLGAFKASACDRAGCHTPPTPPSEPMIDPADPQKTWAAFAAFKLSNGKLYVDPCSTDAAKSTIGANVNAAAPVADRGALMPLGSTTGLPADVIAKIDTWLKCGAPNN